MSITTILGPLIMNNLFKYFTTDKAPVYFPGVSFLLGAIFMLTSVLIAWRVLSRERIMAVAPGA
jgi:DHA1 family tetracycline resistance protein-like MFS transporter